MTILTVFLVKLTYDINFNDSDYGDSCAGSGASNLVAFDEKSKAEDYIKDHEKALNYATKGCNWSELKQDLVEFPKYQFISNLISQDYRNCKFIVQEIDVL